MAERFASMIEDALSGNTAAALAACEDFELEVRRIIIFLLIFLLLLEFLFDFLRQHAGGESLATVLPFYRVQMMTYLFEDM
jgi:hypothetical protein